MRPILKRYRAGEFDIDGDLPNDQLAWLKENMPKELHIAPYAGVYYYTFNTAKPPLSDQRICQALIVLASRTAPRRRSPRAAQARP